MSVHDKTGRKSVFHPHEAHILARLDITLLYTMFLWLWKISNFGSRPKRVNLHFYLKICVHGENGSKICIPSPWDLYSVSVRYFSVVHKFFGGFKNIEFRLKTQMGQPLILSRNVCSRWKLAGKPYFNPVRTIFYPSLKNIEFRLKT
jgi:hypothetical protein